jgi:hypothetical protein
MKETETIPNDRTVALHKIFVRHNERRDAPLGEQRPPLGFLFRQDLHPTGDRFEVVLRDSPCVFLVLQPDPVEDPYVRAAWHGCPEHFVSPRTKCRLRDRERSRLTVHAM